MGFYLLCLSPRSLSRSLQVFILAFSGSELPLKKKPADFLSLSTTVGVKLTGIVSISCPVPHRNLSSPLTFTTSNVTFFSSGTRFTKRPGRAKVEDLMVFSQSDWTDDSLQETPWVLVALMDFVCWKKPQNSCRNWLQLTDNQQKKNSSNYSKADRFVLCPAPES